MPNTEITTGQKTQGQFAIQFAERFGAEIPTINNRPEPMLMFGYDKDSETDRQAAIDLLTQAAQATGGNVMEMRSYIMNAMMTAANDIVADEAVDVGGIELLINYDKKEIYLDTEKLADLSDIDANMEPQVIKALLVERANTALIEMYYPYTNDDEEEYGEEFDW